MDQNAEQPQKKIPRRSFLKAIVGLGAAIGLGNMASPAETAQAKVPNSTPLSEQQKPPLMEHKEEILESKINLYDDLTPGIGIGVAWIGSGSQWNTVVENIIKATVSVDIPPHVFVPKQQEENFDQFMNENQLPEGSYIKIICDPEYVVNEDAVDMNTGKTQKMTKSGFETSWIRDWGTWIINQNGEKKHLDIRKDNMTDPLKGTEVNLPVVENGLKFDGGAFFFFHKQDGTPIFLGSKNELVNNNRYNVELEMGKDINLEEEVNKKLKETFGTNTDVVLLPRLADNGVDHIDTFVMPLGEDNIVIGEAEEGDPNYDMLNEVALMLAQKGLTVNRVPLRRVGKNDTVTYTNVLPHITPEGEKYIFMPVYSDFEEENDIAKTIYSKLGFTVVPVDSNSTIGKGGSIHCATNSSITSVFINEV